MSASADRFAVIDENFAANLRERREAHGLSQDELAQRMTDRGFGFSQATIWKIEQGKRPVKLSEVVALADAIGMLGWTTLALQPHASRHHGQLQDSHRRAGDAYNAVKAAAHDYLRAQIEVAVSVHEARAAGISVRELWTAWLDMPAERAAIEARVEFEQEDVARDQLEAAVEQVLQALRAGGFEAIIDPDSIEGPEATPITEGPAPASNA